MKSLLTLLLILPALARADEYPYLEELYKHFPSHPELSLQEHNTAARVAQELRKAGFEVTEEVGGLGVVAVLENGPGPTLMLRADLDALPIEERTGLPYASTVKTVDASGNTVGVMHACGHDIHMTSVIGAARQLGNQRSEWRGTVVVIGQPAEEVGAGAKAMIDDGLFRRFPKPDFIVAIHASPGPEGVVGFTPGPTAASVDMIGITVRGVGGHGAAPHRTKDPIVLSSEIVMVLQTIVSREVDPINSAVITVGSIHGGTKHNIIPEEVQLQLTVRAYSPEVRNQLLAAIERISVGMARTAGLSDDRLPIVSLQAEPIPVTINDPALTERLVTALRVELGATNVREEKPVMAGEDFSRYSLTEDKIPAVLLWVGSSAQQRIEAGEAMPSPHSPYYAPLPEPTIRTGVRVLVHSALTLLSSQ